MVIIRRLLLFAIILSSSFIAFAQQNPKPGFIILHSNDTLRGNIAFIKDEHNHLFCRFRNDNMAADFNPNEVLGAGFYEDKFFSTQIIENQFVEVVVDGLLSLYKFDSAFYVKKGAYALHRLEPDILEGDQSLQIRNNHRWKGVFNLWCSDCPSTVSAINELRAKEKELIHFIINYNRCVGSDYKEFRAEKQWFKSIYGIYVGFSKTKINSKFSEVLFPYLAKSYVSMDPTFGVVFTVSSPRISENIFFQTELNFNRSKYYSFIEVEKYNRFQYFQTDISIVSLSAPLSIGYRITEGKWKCSLFAGISPNFHFNSNASLFTEEVEDDVVTSYHSSAFSIHSIEIGPRGGAIIQRDFSLFTAGLIVSYQINAIDNTVELSTMLNRLAVSFIIQSK